MSGVIFAIFISIGLPLTSLVYAIIAKRYIPFVLGMFAFIGAQVLIRLPLLEFLKIHSINYLMLSAMQPVLFSVFIGLSAGVFEELARFIMMRFFMRQRDWKSGLMFGIGHGGVEAILFIGISAFSMMFSPLANAYNADFFIGGIERFFALLLHIGLSIIVLQSVVQRKLIYVVLAMIIHGFVDTLVGILPLIMSPKTALIAVEVSVSITALAIFSYSISIKRREVLQ